MTKNGPSPAFRNFSVDKIFKNQYFGTEKCPFGAETPREGGEEGSGNLGLIVDEREIQQFRIQYQAKRRLKNEEVFSSIRGSDSGDGLGSSFHGTEVKLPRGRKRTSKKGCASQRSGHVSYWMGTCARNEVPILWSHRDPDHLGEKT
jgi:hypothetical protein